MMTPQADIDWALQVEKTVKWPTEAELYLECMNNFPMHERTREEDIRNGCILTGVFVRCRENR